MQVCVLGPLEVRIDGASPTISGARLRRLLLRLAVDAPAAVPPSTLMSAVWPDGRPADEANALQALISRLRRTLADPALVLQVPGGYRLAVTAEDVDARLFVRLATQGRAQLAQGRLQAAADTLEQAVALWRGEPLFDADDADYSQPLVVRLTEQYLEAAGDLIEAKLGLGRHPEVMAELEQLVAAEPLRERFTGLLMTGLAASGRTAEGLAAYERLRSFLADQLGADPSPELREQHLSLLRGQPVGPPPELRPDRGTPRGNLSYQLTSFIGREQERARVTELLAEHRLTTIVGPGGAGKTRLASQLAADIADRSAAFRDGIWLVELARVTDEAGVEAAVLDALGARSALLLERTRDRRALDVRDRLLDVLESAEALLLVDNCEHLIAGVSTMVDRVLRRCPGVRILATSREPLGIVGEALCVIPPLGVPPEDVQFERLDDYPAVRLLNERATAVRPGFAVDESTAPAVIEIVRRLDGLPLAIELAAARLRTLPVEEIASRLGDRFRLLSSGNRTAERRHQTLQAVVEWSWELLSDAERLLAQRLSVFPAGVTAVTAVAVCAGDGLDGSMVAELLDSLADKSLLQVSESGPLRYRMLETIREFGTDRLSEQDRLTAARTAHARYFAELAARLDPVLRSADQLAALAEFDAERENMVAALRFLGDAGQVDTALRLCTDLAWYWSLVGANTESLGWIEFVLRSSEGSPNPLRDCLEGVLAMASLGRGGRSELLPIADRLVIPELAREPMSQLVAPLLAFIAGDNARGDALMDRALLIEDPWLTAALHVMRANFAENTGDVPRMRAETDLGLQLFEPIGDRWGIANALSARSAVRRYDGDIDGAIADVEAALRMVGQLGATDDDLMMHLRLCELRAIQGDLAGARAILAGLSEQLHHEPGPAHRRVFILAAEANLASMAGDVRTARELTSQLRSDLHRRTVGRELYGHVAALTGAVASMVAVDDGDLELAAADLATAYPEAVGTGDRPVIAAVVTASAYLAAARQQPEIAARMLGAATMLRGAADPGEPRTAALTTRLRAILGDGFDVAYHGGVQLSPPQAIAALGSGPASVAGHGQRDEHRQ